MVHLNILKREFFFVIAYKIQIVTVCTYVCFVSDVGHGHRGRVRKANRRHRATTGEEKFYVFNLFGPSHRYKN